MSGSIVSTGGLSAEQFNFAAKYLNEYELPTMVSASQKGGKSAAACAEEAVELELRIRELFRQCVQFPISAVASGLAALSEARNALDQQKGFTIPLKSEMNRILPFVLQQGALNLLSNKNPKFHGVFDFHLIKKDVDVIWKAVAALVPGEGDVLDRGRKAFEDVTVPVLAKAQAMINASIELDQLNETHLWLITKQMETAIKVDQAAASLKHKPSSGSVSSSSSSPSSSTTPEILNCKDELIETVKDVERAREIDALNAQLLAVKSSIRGLLQTQKELRKKVSESPAHIKNAKEKQQTLRKEYVAHLEKLKQIEVALASADKAYQEASKTLDKISHEKAGPGAIWTVFQVKDLEAETRIQWNQLSQQAESLPGFKYRLKLVENEIAYQESNALAVSKYLASITQLLCDVTLEKKHLRAKLRALRQPSKPITPPTVVQQTPKALANKITDQLFDILLFCSSEEYLSMKQEDQSKALYARFEELPPGVQISLGHFLRRQVNDPSTMKSDWLKQHIADDFDVLNKAIALTIEKINQKII